MIAQDRPSLTARTLEDVTASALVVGVGSGPDGPLLLTDALPAEAATALEASLELLGVRGGADEVHRLPGVGGSPVPLLVLVGVGPLDEEGGVSSEALRRAAGAAVRSLAGTDAVALALPSDSAERLAAVAEGAAMGAYAFTALKSETVREESRRSRPVRSLEVVTDLGEDVAGPALRRAAVVGDAVCAVRDLVNTAPSHLYPSTFADAVEQDLAGTSVDVTVWDEGRLAAEGFGGILAIGQGSSRPPRLVRLEHAPEGAAAHIALVGKGITFDTGGISLKPAASMMTMKSDMAGAATVFAVVRAAAALQLPVKVTGWLALAENMPSDTAIRPSDVVTMYGGKTVEIMNTDAEGRVVMADALVAATDERPDAVLDIATLTGAQLVALGTRYTGVMGDEALCAEVVAAADRVGELAWAMPIPENQRASLDSRVADLSNMGDKFGGMMTAAAFLREFVDAGRDAAERAESPTPWAHLDIAGPSFNDAAAHGYTPRDATGVMVRTLVGLIAGRAG
ncbi:leucyl aminopeptidase [Micrococcus sp. EYE_162]|uniref:leucyl aminopeptidase n=1 Tax=unclassified Micrococcus TaxID=2620948 RepID=UPI002003A70D|nr:leucyl aminopeptidase [Micrococcus sp. EYE_212]MCK6170899.1 leucyl aminopeptidase [Micrococcus sp. EYE_162]